MGKEKIQEIDDLVSKIKADVIDYALTLEFTNCINFKPGDKTKFEGIPKSPGLYFFSIKNTNNKAFADWLSWFQPIWEMDYIKKKFTPNTSKKRVNVHLKKNDCTEWIPLYLGKSQNIQSELNSMRNSY